MALGARGSPVSLLDQLLEEINFQRTKEMRQLFKDESGFVVLQGTTQWTDLFVRHFLFAEDAARAIDRDDLLFFVRKRHLAASCRLAPKYETVVEVFRKESKKLPIGDPEIEWEETVYLNLIVHQLEYTLTLAVCTRTGPRALQVLRRHCAKVYASPSRRKMDSKGEGEEITYPHICFMVDNFDEVFNDIVVRDGEMVCVELSARGRGARARAALFLGSVRYDALNRVYDSRQSSFSQKMAQRMTFGLAASGAGRCELLRVRGPHGKGHAEVAVWRARGASVSGCDTPASEPGLSYADLWDPDLNDEVPPTFYSHQRERRLSDPSANMISFARGSAGGTVSERCRSQQDGLDALADPTQPEVQAGDVRDVDARRGSASSSCCRPCSTGSTGASMGDVYTKRAEPAYNSPECLEQGGEATAGEGKKGKSSTVKARQVKVDEPTEKTKYTKRTETTGEVKTVKGREMNEVRKGKMGEIEKQLGQVKYTKRTEVVNHSSECFEHHKEKAMVKGQKVNEDSKQKRKTSTVKEKEIKVENSGQIKYTNRNESNYNSSQQSGITPEHAKDQDLTVEGQEVNEVEIKPGQEKMQEKSCLSEYIVIGKEVDSVQMIGRENLIENIVKGKEEKLASRASEPRSFYSRMVKGKQEKLQHDSNKTLPESIKDQEKIPKLGIKVKQPKQVSDKSLPGQTVRGREEKPAIREYRLPTHMPPMRKDNKPMRLKKPKTERPVRIESSPSRLQRPKEGIDSPMRLVKNTKQSRSCDTLGALCKSRTPPARTAPDGTVIHYWCDLPNIKHELDDGIYNPVVGGSRSLGPLFAHHKDMRRAHSQPLSAALTYLTLPWWAIAKDILDVREEPILTF